MVRFFPYYHSQNRFSIKGNPNWVSCLLSCQVADYFLEPNIRSNSIGYPINKFIKIMIPHPQSTLSLFPNTMHPRRFVLFRLSLCNASTVGTFSSFKSTENLLQLLVTIISPLFFFEKRYQKAYKNIINLNNNTYFCQSQIILKEKECNKKYQFFF